MFRVQTLVCSSTLMSLRSTPMRLLHFFVRLLTSDLSYTCKRVERKRTQRSLFAGDKGFCRPQTDSKIIVFTTTGSARLHL